MTVFFKSRIMGSWRSIGCGCFYSRRWGSVLWRWRLVLLGWLLYWVVLPSVWLTSGGLSEFSRETSPSVKIDDGFSVKQHVFPTVRVLTRGSWAVHLFLSILVCPSWAFMLFFCCCFLWVLLGLVCIDFWLIKLQLTKKKAWKIYIFIYIHVGI